MRTCKLNMTLAPGKKLWIGTKWMQRDSLRSWAGRGTCSQSKLKVVPYSNLVKGGFAFISRVHCMKKV